MSANAYEHEAESRNRVTHTAINAVDDSKPHHHGGHPDHHGEKQTFGEKLADAVDTVENKLEDAAKYVGESIAGKESGSAHEL
ncbi:hypothetical protein DICA0_D12134 [Diutina catenulata]